MRSFLPKNVKKRIASFLAHYRTVVLCTIDSEGIWHRRKLWKKRVMDG